MTTLKNIHNLITHLQQCALSMQRNSWLLILGVAFVAMVTTACNPTRGVTAAFIGEDGKVEASSPELVVREYEYGEIVIKDEGGNVIDHESVETPRGTFVLEGPNVIRKREGTKEIAYSASFLGEESNKRAQIVSTNRLGPRVITTKPYSITYDEQNDTILVALGLEGAVTGTRDGVWTRVNVDQYTPSDFSFTGKTRTLLRLLVLDLYFVAVISVVSLSFASFAIAVSSAPDVGAKRPLVGALAAIVAIPTIIMATWEIDSLRTVVVTLTILSILIAYIYVVPALIISNVEISPLLRKTIGLVFSALSVLASVFSIVMIRFYFDPGGGLISGQFMLFLVACFASLNAISAVAVTRPTRSLLGPLIGALVGMYLLFAVCFSLWYWAILPQEVAQILVLLFLASASAVLWCHLNQRGMGLTLSHAHRTKIHT